MSDERIPKKVFKIHTTRENKKRKTEKEVKGECKQRNEIKIITGKSMDRHNWSLGIEERDRL